MPNAKSGRRDQILQALAAMLEQGPDTRITTARLAKEVGVSEAALYRHFPSKTKMYEALIEFVEDTLFSRIARIHEDAVGAVDSCNKILLLLLGFCERNPGITRILHGDALLGESERLHLRVAQLFDRIETQLRTVLREAEIKERVRPNILLADAAGLLLAAAEGRIAQFVRSGFKRSPTQGWEQQWSLLTAELMRPVPA